eukprot:60811-Chlamydomonas_euryale.AAC.1
MRAACQQPGQEAGNGRLGPPPGAAAVAAQRWRRQRHRAPKAERPRRGGVRGRLGGRRSPSGADDDVRLGRVWVLAVRSQAADQAQADPGLTRPCQVSARSARPGLRWGFPGTGRREAGWNRAGVELCGTRPVWSWVEPGRCGSGRNPAGVELGGTWPVWS